MKHKNNKGGIISEAYHLACHANNQARLKEARRDALSKM